MPSSKKLIGKKCAYCGSSDAESQDHIIARGFFSKDQKYRENIPQVPSCKICNGHKSELENWVSVLLQFGGSSEASRKMIDDRLKVIFERNKTISEYFKENLNITENQHGGEIVYDQAIIKIDNDLLDTISSWFKYILRASYYLWRDFIACSEWSFVTLNPPNIEVYKYFSDMIDLSDTNSKHEIHHENGSWLVKLAESEDGLILGRVDFNSISQFVLVVKDSTSTTAQTWKKLGYQSFI